MKLDYQFAMYNPVTDTVEVSVGAGTVMVLSCQEYNATVTLEDPDDIVYLYRLARETPMFYAELALMDGGLQGFAEGMGWFNY